VTLDHFYSTMLSLSHIHKPHVLIGSPKPSYFRTWFYGWVVLLSHAVLNLRTSLLSL
jgi:hypothetical protein